MPSAAISFGSALVWKYDRISSADATSISRSSAEIMSFFRSSLPSTAQRAGFARASVFLYLGPGRLGFVLADISGKGISAALLMASLQASLRSQYAQAPDDLPRVLRAVNRTFFDSTATSRYATLFFAIYDEPTAAAICQLWSPAAGTAGT